MSSCAGAPVGGGKEIGKVRVQPVNSPKTCLALSAGCSRKGGILL